MAAASVLKRQDGKSRRQPSKPRNRAWGLAWLTSCKLRTEGESTPVGSCNPSHTCADGIKGQLRRGFIIWLWAVEGAEQGRAELTGASFEMILLSPGPGLRSRSHVWTQLPRIWTCSAKAYPRDLFSRDDCLLPGFVGARLAWWESLLNASVSCLELGPAGVQPSSVVMELGVWSTRARYTARWENSTTCRETNRCRVERRKYISVAAPPCRGQNIICPGRTCGRTLRSSGHAPHVRSSPFARAAVDRGSSGTVFAWDLRWQQQPIVLSGVAAEDGILAVVEQDLVVGFQSVGHEVRNCSVELLVLVPSLKLCSRQANAAIPVFDDVGGYANIRGSQCPVFAVAFPIFQKWDITKLVNATRGVKLTGHVEFEMEINAKDSVIAELHSEVDKLRRANDTQALHLVRVFGSSLQVKDDEVKKLRTENIEPRRALAVLEEQFAEHEVHNVTQAFCNVNVTSLGMYRNVAADDNMTNLVDNPTPRGQFTIDEGGQAICGPNSFVRNIKCKARKELKMPRFEYQDIQGQTINKAVVAGNSTTTDVGCSGKRAVYKDVIDVDEGTMCVNKKSGFDINNRHGVRKMMTVEEKSKISNAYNVCGDRPIMWNGHKYGVTVYFTDVIDVYVVLLSAEQDRINEGVEVPEKSYFFSSIRLNVVLEVQRQAMRDCWVDTQDFNKPLESVVDCPQQRPDLLDCAIIVCAVIHQYAHHVDVGRSLHDGNCSVLRATMVKEFINDLVRGLKNDTD
ncbi:hypothetical protein HYC85_003639 [Camellia sinensis]|uniref:Ubiquitin-like protease family profile domain-containing protein n=1 Tax=Camellia sinensis TaxID=4442 RepID=A0A7J7HWF4_CAMSI|nr:hypothetical protein HYC85_003639 [Camellia sinensis]